jgi:translation initiation factor IF-2
MLQTYGQAPSGARAPRLRALQGKQRVSSALQKFPSARPASELRAGAPAPVTLRPRGLGRSRATALRQERPSAPSAPRLGPSPRPCPRPPPRPERCGERGRVAATAAGAPEPTPARRPVSAYSPGLQPLDPPPLAFWPAAAHASPAAPRRSGGAAWALGLRWVKCREGRGGLSRGRGRASGTNGSGPAGETATVSAAAGCGEGRGERGCQRASESQRAEGGRSPARGGAWRARRGVCLFYRWVATMARGGGPRVTRASRLGERTRTTCWRRGATGAGQDPNGARRQQRRGLRGQREEREGRSWSGEGRWRLPERMALHAAPAREPCLADSGYKAMEWKRSSAARGWHRLVKSGFI